MPTDIKKATIALAISLIATLLAVYLEGLNWNEVGFNNLIVLGVNALWLAVIIWLIWDLLKGKGTKTKLTLILVGTIMVASLAWDFFTYGYKPAQMLYAIKILMLAVAYSFLSSEKSEAWLTSR